MLSTDCIRYSTTQDTNALVQRAGPQLCLLVADLLNAFLHPAMQRFLFNAGRRLPDAPPAAVADLPAEADRVFAPSRPGLTRSRDEAGPILGATGPGLALRIPHC